MKVTRRCQRFGFTLIEILVAIAIFALVITAIYSGWMAILKASKAGLEVAARIQRQRIAVHTIQEALTSARSFSADVQHYAFILENGSDPKLSFVARLPKLFPRSGRFDTDVRRVSFSLESGPDSQRQLVLRQSPILMEFGEDELNHPLVLAKEVEEFSPKAWNPNGNEWVEEWTQTNQLPKMVKVTLRMASPNQRYPSSSKENETTLIIALPSVSVPQNWQMPPRPMRGRPLK